MLKPTGERLLPWDLRNPQNHYEHLQRYQFAAQFVKNRRVLELGCGEGYGAHMLARTAKQVVGVDIDTETIAWATGKYLRENLSFLTSSALDIPISGKGIFDLVVCFELLEHIEEQEQFLAEAKRLLRRDGLLILSTPNKFAYSDEPGYRNPFHKRELNLPQLRELVDQFFQFSLFLGQRVHTGSSLWPLNAEASASRVSASEHLIRKGPDEFAPANSEDRTAMYYVVVASNKPLAQRIQRVASTHFYLLDLSDSIFKELADSHREAEKYQTNLLNELETSKKTYLEKEEAFVRLQQEARAYQDHLNVELENAKETYKLLEKQTHTQQQEFRAKIEELNQDLTNSQRRLEEHQQARVQLAEQEQRIQRLQAELAQATESRLQFERAFHEREEQLTQELAEQQQLHQQADNLWQAARGELQTRRTRIAQQQKELQIYQNQLSQVEKDKERFRLEAERLQRWRRIRQKLAPDGSLRHSLMLLLRSLAERILRVSRGYERGASVGEQPAVLLWCDEPNFQTTPRLSGITCIRGWAIARSKIGEIRVFLDDAELGRAFYGFLRDDVSRKYLDLGDDVHVGFAFRFDTSKVPPGMYSLKILATSESGETASIEGKVGIVRQRDNQLFSKKRIEEEGLKSVFAGEKKTSTTPAAQIQEGSVDLSIIILARNQARILLHSLPLLAKQKTAAKFEIIGIDTESEDGTADVFRRNGARVFSVTQKEFHHFHTRLLGVERARGRLVVFLVGDAIPANEHWLQALVQPLLEDPLVAATYSRQLPAPNCVPWEARDIYRGSSVVREVKHVDWSQPIAAENYTKHQWKFIAFSDVSSCYRKELLQSLPTPDGISQVEDQYWCKCLLEKGYRIVLEPTSLVVHSHNESVRRLYRRQLIQGRCFSLFMDVQPEPLHMLLLRTLEDAAGDLFFVATNSNGGILRKLKWVVQIPVMRFVKRYGFRGGVRQSRQTKEEDRKHSFGKSA